MRKIKSHSETKPAADIGDMIVISDWPVYSDRRFGLADYLYLIGLRQIVSSATGISPAKLEKVAN